MPAAVEQPGDLRAPEHLGLLLRRLGQGHSARLVVAFEHHREQEPARARRLVQRAVRQLALAHQVQQARLHLLRAERFRAPAVVPGHARYGLHVALLRALGQSAHQHRVQHPLA
jgi:cellobiose-specific phosphotransferase system component IIA